MRARMLSSMSGMKRGERGAPAGPFLAEPGHNSQLSGAKSVHVGSPMELSSIGADQALSAPSAVIDLSNHALTTTSASCLAKLALFTRVARLNVSGCGLTDAYFQSFVPTLRLSGVQVEHFDVSRNAMSDEGAAAMAKYLLSSASRYTHTLVAAYVDRAHRLHHACDSRFHAHACVFAVQPHAHRPRRCQGHCSRRGWVHLATGTRPTWCQHAHRGSPGVGGGSQIPVSHAVPAARG